MLSHWKKAAYAAALAIGSMTAAASAEAHDRYYDRGDDTAAVAIGAGVIGLALGAALSSDRYDHYYYGGDRYYRGYPRGDYYYYDRAPRRYYRDYPRYRNDWRHDRRDWRRDRWRGDRDHRAYRRGW